MPSNITKIMKYTKRFLIVETKNLNPKSLANLIDRNETRQIQLTDNKRSFLTGWKLVEKPNSSFICPYEVVDFH